MADKKIDITVGSSKELPTRAKLAHVLAVLVSAVIALCVSAVLADGTSVIKLKDPSELPRVTAYEMREFGIDYRLDELMGETYGIGLHHDQSGRSWTDIGAVKTVRELIRDLGIPVIAGALPSVIMTDGLKHPVPLLECKELQTAGLAAMSFGYIALVVAGFMTAFHALLLAGLLPSSLGKPLACLIWLTVSSGFLIVIALAVGIYTSVWKCDQEIIPEIKLSDHFEYNYGFGLALVGYVSSLLMLAVQLSFTSMSDNKANAVAPKCALLKAVVVIAVGSVLGGVVATVVLSSAGNFDDVAPVDPDINPCAGKKPYHGIGFGNPGSESSAGDNYFSNTECFRDQVAQTLEQAGANVTKGFRGGMDAADRYPITVEYKHTDLCPVNVHWHLGAEHLSVGEYDEHGTGPDVVDEETHDGIDHSDDGDRRLAAAGAAIRLGGRCHHYNAADPKFADTYVWEHCTNMHIGETYEVHWPHSAAGACGTVHQYQTPFYDGVFCREGVIRVAPLNTYEKIGVQAQIFTIVNSDAPEYQYDHLIDGMIMGGPNGAHGDDIAKYTGSTTGTSRTNAVCSRFTPITWQVDRKCHMISARSFDKMCADMKGMADDMSGDLYPHGAREVASSDLVANNQWDRRKLDEKKPKLIQGKIY